MKMLSNGRVSLLGLMLASVGVSNAARETLSVTERGIEFTGVRYDDGRNKPYRLRFRQDGTRSLYSFNTAGQVTNIKVGTERYKVLYGTNDRVESVELTSSTRRALAQEEEENDAATFDGRRLDFDDCDVCEEAWEALCEDSISVCDLEDFGSPISAMAATSVDTACGTFGSACSRFGASQACEDQCPPVEVVVGASSSNSCLDPTSEEYKCTFSGDTTMEFTDCDLENADVHFLPACFEEFGKTNIETLMLDNGFGITAYPEGTFAGLSELTFLDLYSNALRTVPEGLFDGLTKLEFLDIAFNDLTSLAEGAFSDLASLQILRLFDNELTPETLPIGLFSGVPMLQELYLGGNNLRDMTGLEGLFDGLAELTRLDLSESGIVTVPEGLFAGLTKLDNLSFYINGLRSLPDGLFSGLTALGTLELTDNALTSLGTSLSGLTSLRVLQLEYNDLLLTEDVFSGLVSLEVLDFEACGLTTLPAGVFSPLVNLESIDFADNEDLQCLPSTTATDIFLDSEDIRDGTCGCTPEEAVFCDDGFSCQSGRTGYTCVAE